MIIDLNTKRPLCRKCKSPMVDATALMMGVRYRCIKECSRITEHEWERFVSKSKPRGRHEGKAFRSSSL